MVVYSLAIKVQYMPVISTVHLIMLYLCNFGTCVQFFGTEQSTLFYYPLSSLIPILLHAILYTNDLFFPVSVCQLCSLECFILIK